MAPPCLATGLHSLPPILHIPCQNPAPGCSKGPRGLSVLPRVGGIFTTTTTSPGPSLRQRPSRYAIRAGRNLPDKEFRYLRTVIVTAAVYRGFGSGLLPLTELGGSPLPLTFRHWAGFRPHTSSYEFAEPCVFGKQSPGPITCGLLPLLTREGAFTYKRPPFSRGYGVNLPSSLARVHPRALAHLCPPTCVGLRYGHPGFNAHEAISWQWGKTQFPRPKSGSPSPLRLRTGISLGPSLPYRLRLGNPWPSWAIPPASPPGLHQGGRGILTPFPSPTPFGLRLGTG